MSEQISAAVTPINVPERPIGTLQELAEDNFDPATTPSCAFPNRAAGIKGCDWCSRCQVSAKAKSGRRNYGVEIIKGRATGGGITRSTVDCTWIAEHHDDIVRNGGSLIIIAEEGETYRKVTSIAKNNLTHVQTFNSRDPNTYREEDLVEVRVEPFPRPNQNRALLRDRLLAEAAQGEKERLNSEARARSLGITGAGTPLDKRAPRESDGPAPSGGGKPAGK